ncbi:MAG: VWA domain-containing protein [Deltaproteobacteria bacterium]|nr:VWA domain-containing protein [Deltaproteobacteria bacterium]
MRLHRARAWGESRGWAHVVVLAVGMTAGCPQAPKVDPGLVEVTTAVDRPEILAGKPGEVVLQVKVTARQPARAQRPPLNLAIVIDTSGSMEGEPIEAAKEAVRDVLGRLHGGDRAAIVGFGSVAKVLGAGTWDSDAPPAELVEAVGKIEAAGTTDMRAGLTAALDATSEWRNQDHLSRIILLSDGKPNDPLGLVDLATLAGSQGMAIVAFGLGIEFDEALLTDMARASGGSYKYLSGPDQLAERFQTEILKLETLVARSVSVEVVPGPGIEILEVPGWDDLSPGREAVIALGDLVGGKEREVLLRLGYGERSHEARVELADVKVRYLDAYGGSGFQEKTYYVGIRATEDAAAAEAALNKVVQERLASVHAHLTAIAAAEDMRRGDIAAAGQVLTDGITAYRQVVNASDELLLEREEYNRLDRLRQAVERADGELAARAREEAQAALDRDGVGALTAPGQPAGTTTAGLRSTGGGAGTGSADATYYGGEALAAPAAMPAEPYEWSDDECDMILQEHSEAYGGMYGN